MKPRYQSYQDAELMELAIQQDTYAFKELYDRHWAVLFNFARRLVGDEDEAKDIIQETFANLYERIGSLKIETSIFSYLYQSVRNAALDINKHQKVRLHYMQTFKDYYNSGVYVTDDQVRENELAQLIEREIETLPPKMRAIFELSRKSYLSHKEIALQIGLREGTVKKQLHYAIKKLRSKLGCFLWLYTMSLMLMINQKF